MYTISCHNIGMTEYEKQLQEAADKQIKVIERWDMGNDPDHPPLKGLYVDGCAALSDDLDTTAERTVILAEEIAHHDLTVGDILTAHDALSRKQELKARTLSYDRLVGLQGLVRAYSEGCRNRYEVAECLGVTEEFLAEAVERYREIYGPATSWQEYVIIFDPGLAIMKVI